MAPLPAATGPASPAAGAIVVVLVMLDERLHSDGVTLPMAVTHDRALPAAGLDEHVGEQHAGIDLHRRDVRHMDRRFPTPDPVRREVHHRRGRDQHLCRQQAVAATQTARPEQIASGERAPLHPDSEHPKQNERAPPPPSVHQSQVWSVVVTVSTGVDVKLFSSGTDEGDVARSRRNWRWKPSG